MALTRPPSTLPTQGAVLRQPLPSVHLDLAPVSAFVALPHLAEQEEVRQREAAARGDQTERDKDTIWALPHADVFWLDVTVPKRERVVTFASSDGFDGIPCPTSPPSMIGSMHPSFMSRTVERATDEESTSNLVIAASTFPTALLLTFMNSVMLQ